MLQKVYNDDYKKLLFSTEKQVSNGRNLGGSGLNQETVMLNVHTTSSLIQSHDEPIYIDNILCFTISIILEFYTDLR